MSCPAYWWLWCPGLLLTAVVLLAEGYALLETARHAARMGMAEAREWAYLWRSFEQPQDERERKRA